MQTRRENSSLLAKIESSFIGKVLPHIPLVVTSDHLTYLGLGGAFLTALAFVGCLVSAAFLPLAILGLFLNWIGDSFDGNLARYRSKERPRYGFMIDHSVDLLSTTLILIGLGASPYLPFGSACFALIIYLLFAGFVYIKICSTGVHKLAFGGLGATEFRLLVAAWALLIHVFHLEEAVTGTYVEWYGLRGIIITDLVVGGACCVAFLGFGVVIFRQAAKLRHVDSVHLDAESAKVVDLSFVNSRPRPAAELPYDATRKRPRSIPGN